MSYTCEFKNINLSANIGRHFYFLARTNTAQGFISERPTLRTDTSSAVNCAASVQL